MGTLARRTPPNWDDGDLDSALGKSFTTRPIHPPSAGDAAGRRGAPPHRPRVARVASAAGRPRHCRQPPPRGAIAFETRIVWLVRCLPLEMFLECIRPCFPPLGAFPARRRQCGLAPSFSSPPAPRHSRCARGRTHAGHRAAQRCAAARRRRRQRARAVTLQKRRRRTPERR